ncbi:MAG: PorT family protein [Cyclobacteriaceae bacterium]|nr:PorT family protein [Cyclobacteriaceae bacterium]
MHTAYIWNKLHLHRSKVILLFVIVLCGSQLALAQKGRWVQRNNPNYDEKKLTYGFLIGLHTAAYQIKYSDKFVSPAFDTVFAVQPAWKPGFSLGFIVNYKLADFLDIRLTPEVAFYEHSLTYLYTDDTPTDQQLVETTMVEFPILLKYKSERRGNIRMYMIGGVKPGIEASGKKDIDQTITTIEIKSTQLNLEFGFGFDLYYPLFKFSPELRFSRGITNVLDNTTNKYGQPLSSITTNTITLYLLFQ